MREETSNKINLKISTKKALYQYTRKKKKNQLGRKMSLNFVFYGDKKALKVKDVSCQNKQKACTNR